MPPGWDGVETIERLWQVDPELQVVICTAYSDHSWEDIRRRLGNSDSLLVLKKPFDTVEVLQIAHALTRKWELAREARTAMEYLDRKVADRTKALQQEMTERIRVENNLRQAQKVEAVGLLAAGIAHDFNNILTVIQGHAGILQSTPGCSPEMMESISQIADAADRAASLTRQLLVFSRKDVVCYKPLDLNGVLANSTAFLGRVLGAPIQLAVQPAPGAICLTADECNLEQIIMNLALNARDAMPDGGVLTLRTSIEVISEAESRRHPQARPGAFACLTVADTGCGMDKATLTRIFEPFFTTKDPGKGTGLGLATVDGIVQRHKGWIEISSELNRGTTFKVFLPHSGELAPIVAKTNAPFMLPPQGREPLTILVVEDDEAVRNFAKTVLIANKYRVVEAVDGVEALEVLARQTSKVDMLFTDIVMPRGISGRALAEKAREERPALNVIYSSGYSAEAIGATWLHGPGVAFLPKPYTPGELLRAVAASNVS